MIIELDNTNFEQETQQGLKLVEFYTTWCMYCKNQRIELMDFENSDVWIGIVDADESPEIHRTSSRHGNSGSLHTSWILGLPWCEYCSTLETCQ